MGSPKYRATRKNTQPRFCPHPTQPAKRTSEFRNQTCVFIRSMCLTLSLNKKFEATLTNDIHWISVFTNQGVNHGNHWHQPFQKLAQIFVGLQLRIFKPREIYSVEIFAVQIMLRVCLKFCVFYLADIGLTCLPERYYGTNYFHLYCTWAKSKCPHIKG